MIFKFLATAIGSFPHTDAGKACNLILDSLPRIPCWPQLPKKNFRENMYVQFSESLPCAVVDEKEKKIYFNTEEDMTPLLERFYERIIAGDVDYFKISEEYASGLYAFTDKIRRYPPKALADIRFIKGQVTGPISFGLTVTDKDNKSVFYNDELVDAVVKNCVMKARWQIRNLKETGINDVIMFIDEPYLVSLGSSFVSLEREQVIKYLDEVIDGIHAENALSGIHCCGNTDWSILMSTRIDIISFDAYNYMESMTLYPDKLKEFLANGKSLAWGIVPNSEKAEKETKEGIISRLKEGIKALVNKGIPEKQLLEQSLITPCCGTGTLSVSLAEKVMRLNKEVEGGLKD